MFIQALLQHFSELLSKKMNGFLFVISQLMLILGFQSHFIGRISGGRIL